MSNKFIAHVLAFLITVLDGRRPPPAAAINYYYLHNFSLIMIELDDLIIVVGPPTGTGDSAGASAITYFRTSLFRLFLIFLAHIHS